MARKNLLFLFTDEQRRDTLGCYGNPRIRTPNLDALAAGGTVFEHAYCTQPVCTPSRGSIMTGLYPHTHRATHNNAPLPADVPTLAELIDPAYRRGYVGKWHLGDEIAPQHGFDTWVSIEDNYRPYYSRPELLEQFSDYHHFLLAHGLTPGIDSLGKKVFGRSHAAQQAEELTKAAFVGEEASRFIRESGDDPFVLYVNFLEPHMPFTGPLNDLYDPAALPVGPQFCQRPPENAARRARTLSDKYVQRGFAGTDLSEGQQGWRTILARYWGLCTMVDNAVGRILGALEESGRAEDTVVVYTSDHGDMMGDHALLAKGVMYDEASSVPLVMRVPWLDGPARVAGRAGLVDLVPTLLELLGQDVPDHIEGRSLRSVLEGRRDLSDNDVFLEWNAAPTGVDEYGIQTSPWRCIFSREGWKLNLAVHEQCELYDLNADPYESCNRFEDPACRERVRTLYDRIVAWQASTGDAAPLPDRP